MSATKLWQFENPRNINESDLVRALRQFGCEPVRQAGSFICLTTSVNGTHHVTVPNHRETRTGTLMGGVLKPIASHHGITIKDLLHKLSR